MSFRCEEGSTRTQSSKKDSFWHTLQVVSWFLQIYHVTFLVLLLEEKFNYHYPNALLRCTYSKLGWLNLGFKQKYASPLADLLAFRKVVLSISKLLLCVFSKVFFQFIAINQPLCFAPVSSNSKLCLVLFYFTFL